MMAGMSDEMYTYRNGLDITGYAPSQELGESGNEGQGEDVFLNLARDPAQRHSLQDKIERRRVSWRSPFSYLQGDC
jgi:hypothetical protein